MKTNLLFTIFFISVTGFSRTGVGIGFYPTGTETGIGVQTAKDTRWVGDARVTRLNIFSEKAKISSFVTELSLVYRIIKLEKVRFNIGLGYRADWNLHDNQKHGAIIPIGVEAFPFPFQNAGLFFEVAPYWITDYNSSFNFGMRTNAGFVFYFPCKAKTSKVQTS